MPYNTLLTLLEDGIFTVTINSPDKLNALNKQVMAELDDINKKITAKYINPIMR